MAEPTAPIEAEATPLTLQELHILSRQKWFRELQRFDPTEYTPGFLRRISKYLHALAAEVDGYIPLAEIQWSKAQAEHDRLHAALHQQMGFPPPPEPRPPAKVLSIVDPEEPPAS